MTPRLLIAQWTGAIDPFDCAKGQALNSRFPEARAFVVIPNPESFLVQESLAAPDSMRPFAHLSSSHSGGPELRKARSDRASRRFRSRGISYCSWTSVKPLGYLFPCHSERSDAQARNLSLLPTSVKLSAHDETSIAARSRRVRQNRFRKIRGAA